MTATPERVPRRPTNAETPASPPYRNDGPSRVEVRAALGFEVAAHRPQVDVVRRPPDEEGAGPGRQDPYQLVAEGGLEGDPGVARVVEELAAHPGAIPVPVLHRADPLETARGDHEGRVCRVDDLMAAGQPLVDEAQQVPLRGGVQPVARLVEQEDHPLRVPELGQRREKREEPGEPVRTFAEVEGDPVPVVPDPELEERTVSVRRPVEVDVELDREAPVLTPPGEHLLGELVRGRLQGCLARFVLVAREVR